MPSNRANTTSQTLPSSRLDHGQPTHFGTFVKSMLHMSHISSFSNNYASNLKLKDYNVILLSPDHINKNCRQSFEREFPTHCNVFYHWYIHVRTQGPSVRLAVDCVCNARNQRDQMKMEQFCQMHLKILLDLTKICQIT